jgi:hypothetical protein
MQIRGLGLIPDAQDDRDRRFDRPIHRAALPAAIDLRNGRSVVRDQGQTNACTGFALAALLEFHGAAEPRAPLFIYYEARLRDGRLGEDRGASFRSALRAVIERGACREALHPFAPRRVLLRPSNLAYEDARLCRAAEYARLIGLGEVKRAVEAGSPVLMGVMVTESFLSPMGGRAPMPAADERRCGWHAVLCLGYRDNAARPGGGDLILQSSWGPGYGDGGFVCAPYAFFEAGLVGDLWVISMT